MKKIKVKRMQICRKCGRMWNISVKANVSRKGYICPDCRREKKKAEGMKITLNKGDLIV